MTDLHRVGSSARSAAVTSWLQPGARLGRTGVLARSVSIEGRYQVHGADGTDLGVFATLTTAERARAALNRDQRARGRRSTCSAGRPSRARRGDAGSLCRRHASRRRRFAQQVENALFSLLIQVTMTRYLPHFHSLCYCSINQPLHCWIHVPELTPSHELHRTQACKKFPEDLISKT